MDGEVGWGVVEDIEVRFGWDSFGFGNECEWVVYVYGCICMYFI